MRSSRFTWPLSAALILSVALISGCGEAPAPADAESESAEPDGAASAPVSTGDDIQAVSLVSKLEAADLLDGAADKTISKCYVCGLGMNGSPEHAAEYEGYTAHLCSEHCQEMFSEDPESIVSSTDVPTAED